MKKPHLIIIGLDETITRKYFGCVANAVNKKFIDSYSIIDLKSQKNNIEQRLSHLSPKPEHIYYLTDPQKSKWTNPDEFISLLKEIERKKEKIIIYIATELKAHESYLRYCVENGIDSLVEKPMFAPMEGNQYRPDLISSVMNELLNKVQKIPCRHSVMTQSRYHRVYNDGVLDPLRERVIKLDAPLTSFHIRHSGGVWNTHEEFESRIDHPYKYGYGSIMHGGYHFIDLCVQFLKLNKLIFPDDKFSMSVASYAAYPKDQNDRISKTFSDKFDDNRPDWRPQRDTEYGETDIVSVFCLKNKKTGGVITLGSISLEQTTPSIRTWKDIPEGLYNKNGRLNCVDFEAQLSTLFAVSTRCYDAPVTDIFTEERIVSIARISTRANAALLKNEEYTTEETYTGIYNSDSNRKIISLWLEGKEEKSRIESHLQTMLLTQYLSLSIQKPGFPLTFDFM